MKKLSKHILERDAKRDIGAEVLEAIGEIKAGGGRRFTVHVSQATEARIKLGLSQKYGVRFTFWPSVTEPVSPNDSSRCQTRHAAPCGSPGADSANALEVHAAVNHRAQQAMRNIVRLLVNACGEHR